MISEVDIRDWDSVDVSLFERAKQEIAEYEYPGACGLLLQFIDQLLAVQIAQQQAATKHIPAIFKKGEE